MIRHFLLALCTLLLCASQAQAKWLKAESSLFIVYGDTREKDLKEFVAELHEYDALLRMFTATKAPETPAKLSIVLARHVGQLRDVAPGVAQTTYGIYSGSPRGTYAVAVNQDVFGVSAETILRHEYAHHFMLYYHPAFYPPWYVEGFAEYFGATEFKDDAMHVGVGTPNRGYWLVNDRWAPIERIMAPKDTRQISGRNFHPQSWLLVHYMMAAPERRAQLSAFINALGKGEDTEKALIATTGMDYSKLNSALKAYLAARQLPGFAAKRTEKDKAEVKITPLSASEEELLLTNTMLTLTYDDERIDADLAADVRKRAAKFGNDPYALRTLALAEIRAGEFDTAAGTLERLAQAAPNDVNTPYLQAMRLIAAGRKDPSKRKELWAQARRHTVAAYKLDPNHYPSLHLYALTALEDGAVPSENTVNAILRAFELAPVVQEIRIEAAVALVRAGQKEGARQLLLPLAYSPHNGGGAKIAREILARMDAGAEIRQPLGDYDCDDCEVGAGEDKPDGEKDEDEGEEGDGASKVNSQ